MAVPLEEFQRAVLDAMAEIRAAENPNWPSWPEHLRQRYVTAMRGNVAMHREVRDVLRAVVIAEERLGLRK